MGVLQGIAGYCRVFQVITCVVGVLQGIAGFYGVLHTKWGKLFLVGSMFAYFFLLFLGKNICPKILKIISKQWMANKLWTKYYPKIDFGP